MEKLGTPRQLLASGVSGRQIERQFGITSSTVSKIKYGQIWKESARDEAEWIIDEETKAVMEAA